MTRDGFKHPRFSDKACPDIIHTINLKPRHLETQSAKPHSHKCFSNPRILNLQGVKIAWIRLIKGS